MSFHGADRSVTGSCHMLECAGRRLLIDCGLVQGSRDLEEENAADFGFDPSAVDTLLLTHAHLDHCGRVPLLVKRGFRGKIVTTAASRDLARLVILDAAHLQEEEAKRRQRRARRGGRESDERPLYTLLDALDSLDRFGALAEYGEPIELAPGLRASFFNAGHILGSASILIEAEEAGKRRRVLFSGDLGNVGRPLLPPPSPPRAAEIVVMESTYGDRRHRPFSESVEELYEAVLATFDRGGNVIIPTFALERAQEILYVLRQGIEQRRLPASMAVFLDSPLAIAATEIFERHPNCYSTAVAELFAHGQDPFGFSGLHFTREAADSIAINRIGGGAVIIAGSGMCTGGRIRHHLVRAGEDGGDVEFDVGGGAACPERGNLPAGLADVRSDHDQAVPAACRAGPDLLAAKRRPGRQAGQGPHKRGPGAEQERLAGPLGQQHLAGHRLQVGVFGGVDDDPPPAVHAGQQVTHPGRPAEPDVSQADAGNVAASDRPAAFLADEVFQV